MVASEFGDEPREIHAIWFGLVDAWLRVQPDASREDAAAEPHYYLLGFALSRVVQVGAAVYILREL